MVTHLARKSRRKCEQLQVLNALFFFAAITKHFLGEYVRVSRANRTDLIRSGSRTQDEMTNHGNFFHSERIRHCIRECAQEVSLKVTLTTVPFSS